MGSKQFRVTVITLMDTVSQIGKLEKLDSVIKPETSNSGESGSIDTLGRTPFLTFYQKRKGENYVKRPFNLVKSL